MLGNGAPRCDHCGIASTHDVRSVTLLTPRAMGEIRDVCPACLDELRTWWRAFFTTDALVRVTRR